MIADGYVSPMPVVAKAVSGLQNVLSTWVIPIACTAAGFALGGGSAYYTGKFVYDWFPFMPRLEGWMTRRVTAEGSRISFPYLIAALLILVLILTTERIVAAYVGSGWYAVLARKALTCFGIGIAIRCLVEGFQPLKAALETAGATTEAYTETSTETSITAVPISKDDWTSGGPPPEVAPLTPGDVSGTGPSPFVIDKSKAPPFDNGAAPVPDTSGGGGGSYRRRI